MDVPLTIPAGSSPPFQVCSSVTVFGDTNPESNEMFTIEIVPENSNDMVTPFIFIVTIQDDDSESCSEYATGVGGHTITLRVLFCRYSNSGW